MTPNCDKNLKTLSKPSYQKRNEREKMKFLRSEEAEDLAINQSWKRVKVNSKLNIESELLKIIFNRGIFPNKIQEKI